MKQWLILSGAIFLMACGSESTSTSSSPTSIAPLEEKLIVDELAPTSPEEASTLSNDSLQKLIQMSEERAQGEALPNNDIEDLPLVEDPIASLTEKAVNTHRDPPRYLEDLIVRHNLINRTGRENLVFVGHGNHSAGYFKDQATKIVDFDGRGLSAQIKVGGRWIDHTASGIFGQPVFQGSQDKFNFWIVQAADTGFDRTRSRNALCMLEKDFEGFENDFLARVPLKHVTFVHMLSDTGCRSQTAWFEVRLDQRLEDLLGNIFSWRRLWNNLQKVASGDIPFYRALTDGVDWGTLFSSIIQISRHPRVMLNILDQNRNGPDPVFVDVAVHELGHAFAHFMDEYSDNTVTDIIHLDDLRTFLDHTINLTALIPSFIRHTLSIPSVRVNPFQLLIGQFDSLGANCAAYLSTAQRRWGSFEGRGSGDETIHTTTGCLYYSNLFYRSSRSSKMRSSLEPFNPYQEAFIRNHFLSVRSE